MSSYHSLVVGALHVTFYVTSTRDHNVGILLLALKTDRSVFNALKPIDRFSTPNFI